MGGTARCRGRRAGALLGRVGQDRAQRAGTQTRLRSKAYIELHGHTVSCVGQILACQPEPRSPACPASFAERPPSPRRLATTKRSEGGSQAQAGAKRRRRVFFSPGPHPGVGVYPPWRVPPYPRIPVSPCLRVPVSPCPRVSASPCLRVPVSPRPRVSVSPRLRVLLSPRRSSRAPRPARHRRAEQARLSPNCDSGSQHKAPKEGSSISPYHAEALLIHAGVLSTLPDAEDLVSHFRTRALAAADLTQGGGPGTPFQHPERKRRARPRLAACRSMIAFRRMAACSADPTPPFRRGQMFARPMTHQRRREGWCITHAKVLLLATIHRRPRKCGGRLGLTRIAWRSCRGRALLRRATGHPLSRSRHGS